MKHYLDTYLCSPLHPITITVIGCGGTGSYVVSQLAKMAIALRELKNIEFAVTVIDDDKVEAHNVGRQLYSVSDIGHYKANVMVGRVNRFYGLDWDSCIGRADKIMDSNIIITCVDNVLYREIVAKAKVHPLQNDHKSNYYWLDFGNSKDYGQYILSTFSKISQPPNDKGAEELPNIFDLYGEIEENLTEPSCSMAESLNQQDLFINLRLATAGIDLLYKLLKTNEISYHGQFMNTATGYSAPIDIK